MSNQVRTMGEAGEVALAVNRKDAQVLAMLGQTIPRVITVNTPEPEKQLDKAEKYAKQASEQMPAFEKPANVSDRQFTQAKNRTLAIAHSGWGLVDFRRGNFEGTMEKLDQAVKPDLKGAATNDYVLGAANCNAKHYEEAVNTCAEFSGNLHSTCRGSAEKAKRLITGQPGAPKSVFDAEVC